MVPDHLLSGAAVLEVVWAAARVASEDQVVDPWAARNPLVVWEAARAASEDQAVDSWAARNPPVAWAAARAALEGVQVDLEDSAMQWRVAAHPELPVSVVAVHKEAQVPEVV